MDNGTIITMIHNIITHQLVGKSLNSKQSDYAEVNLDWIDIWIETLLALHMNKLSLPTHQEPKNYLVPKQINKQNWSI